MTAPDDFIPKTPHCWKCGNWGEGIDGYRLHPKAKLRWKCADAQACDERIKHQLMRIRVGI